EIDRLLLITGLVVAEVGLWQWRMVMASRGSRGRPMLLGTVGAILQITAISQVVTNLRDPFSVGAYAVGVGIGVLLGLVVGDRFTPGSIGVKIVTTVPGVADELWARGWPATAQPGYDDKGPVTILFIAVNRRQEGRLRQDVVDLAP
nr:DUF5698 domain-containing protein [Micromonospora sp. DSM 115978]